MTHMNTVSEQNSDFSALQKKKWYKASYLNFKLSYALRLGKAVKVSVAKKQAGFEDSITTMDFILR